MLSLQEFVGFSDRELGRHDIAEVNLACALSLPGSEQLDVGACTAMLDQWADRTRRETARYQSKYVQNPAEFRRSKAYYRILMLITVLQQDFGVRYNSDRIHQPDFRDANDLFIHGAIFGKGGTCASMPILYVAVGRRLGYPLKLVHAKGHVFARWDDPEGVNPLGKERINIEATNCGLNVFPDEYYRSWPQPLSDAELENGSYLRSLTPREELASFLALRGHCLTDVGRLFEAVEAYRRATEFAPRDPYYGLFLAETAEKLRRARRAVAEFVVRQTGLPFAGISPTDQTRKRFGDQQL
jgi:hypothetical protein